MAHHSASSAVSIGYFGVPPVTFLAWYLPRSASSAILEPTNLRCGPCVRRCSGRAVLPRSYHGPASNAQ